MNADKESLTALITAFTRAYHAANDHPKVFDDFMAKDLFTEEESRQLRRNLASCLQFFDPESAAAGPDEATALALVMRHQMASVLCRARYAEECLEEAVLAGTGQYVILGAGMDTYAFRRSDMAERLRIFEVDHPAMQAFKRKRLDEQGWEIPGHLHFVPFDFTGETFATALSQATYAARQLSFFSWLGVSYYLPREVFFRTLATIAQNAPSGSSIVFDYFDTDAFLPEKADKRMQVIQELVRYSGEPMQTGLDPDTLADDIAAVGFVLKEDLGPKQLDTRYFNGRIDGLRAYAHVRLARAMVA
ncbi:MAG: class I SAM-dependent methyltransferase [Solidesulfovibrio sp.]